MRGTETKGDAAAIALHAMAWTLEEPDRAARLLSVTGLTPQDLRARAAEPAVLVAALEFLEAHEADLVACAGALDVRPTALVAAREELER